MDKTTLKLKRKISKKNSGQIPSMSNPLRNLKTFQSSAEMLTEFFLEFFVSWVQVNGPRKKFITIQYSYTLGTTWPVKYYTIQERKIPTSSNKVRTKERQQNH